MGHRKLRSLTYKYLLTQLLIDEEDISSRKRGDDIISYSSLRLGDSTKDLSQKNELRRQEVIRKLTLVILTGVMCLVGITSALAVKYNEAPMLRTMVAAGELPPVEERLPKEPVVVEPVEEIHGWVTMRNHELHFRAQCRQRSPFDGDLSELIAKPVIGKPGLLRLQDAGDTPVPVQCLQTRVHRHKALLVHTDH